MKAADFDRLVAAACERIPARFRKRLKNVAMIVEAEPHAGQLARGRVPRGGTLLGLYEGFLHNAGSFLTFNPIASGLSFLPMEYVGGIIVSGIALGFIGSLTSLKRFVSI